MPRNNSVERVDLQNYVVQSGQIHCQERRPCLIIGHNACVPLFTRRKKLRASRIYRCKTKTI